MNNWNVEFGFNLKKLWIFEKNYQKYYTNQEGWLYHFDTGIALLSFGQQPTYKETLKLWQRYQPISRLEVPLLKSLHLF